MIKEFQEELIVRLSKELPAHNAHQKVMAHRPAFGKKGTVPENAKQSAVLLLIYPKSGLLHTVFILRPTYPGVHSAQIGFPGGKVEKSDSTLKETALREADEELNIKSENVKILGKMSPIYVPPSNFVVNPFIGFQAERPRFIPEKAEVAKILECPLMNLLGKDKLISTSVEVKRAPMKVKGYRLDDKIVWGATAMMVREFAEIMESIKLPNG